MGSSPIIPTKGGKYADASLEDSSISYKKKNKKSQKEPERKWG